MKDASEASGKADVDTIECEDAAVRAACIYADVYAYSCACAAECNKVYEVSNSVSDVNNDWHPTA